MSKVSKALNSNKIKSKASNTGVDLINKYLKDLTSSPGVYRMLDREGRVLYVGKAKNLKKRVSNYARLNGHSARIGRMISSTASMVFLTTDTEIEALLLEQNLIKQLKPKYNVLLRDDKSFPDIMVSSSHPFPQIVKSRGKRFSENKYFEDGDGLVGGKISDTANNPGRPHHQSAICQPEEVRFIVF